MFRNYLITAIRSIRRHKLYSFINIAGLSVGLTCGIFIALFVRDELSYDRWIPDSSNLYRVELTFHMPGRAPFQLAQAPFPVLQAMKERIPEVNAFTHVVPERMTAIAGDHQFSETVTVVDPNFLQVIKLPLLEGDAASALAEPESIVLSQSVARKYFGAADPLGKTVTLSGADGSTCGATDESCLSAVHSLTVTGVLRDLPHNTQLVADLLLSNLSQADQIPLPRKQQAWTSTDGGYGYVELAAGTDPQTVIRKLTPILDQSVNPKVPGLKLRGSELEQFNLTPFWNVHLTSDNHGGMKPPGSWATVFGFAMVAVMIVLVACFNFMNLATARATMRAREISLRKAVGARRGQLIVQFLGEALLMALLSLAIALALVEMLLPSYDAFLNQPIQFHYIADWSLTLAFVASAVAAGLLSGAYPALVLSAFRPAAVLKMNASTQNGSNLIRTALVVSQFAVSIGLGIAAIVVFTQITFARNVDLGFERDSTIIISGITKLSLSARESFARELSANPGIAGVAFSNAVPFDLRNASNVSVKMPGEAQAFTAHVISIAPELPSLYSMRLLAGRLLASTHGEDLSGQNVLINSEAVRRSGHETEEAVGKMIEYGSVHATIVGILGDAKMDGVRDPVQPTIFQVDPGDNTLLTVRVRGDRIADATSFIDKTWRSFAPGAAIQRYFLSDAFDNLFYSDEKQGVMFALFVGICIFIACLGLFGLAVFSAEQRTKEIVVRKIFGAHTAHIVRMLLWQISIPVLLANVIAWPIAYYYLRHWLDGYAYHISLNPIYFVGAGTTALLIAWATVFAHALRLARASPIGALRHE